MLASANSPRPRRSAPARLRPQLFCPHLNRPHPGASSATFPWSISAVSTRPSPPPRLPGPRAPASFPSSFWWSSLCDPFTRGPQWPAETSPSARESPPISGPACTRRQARPNPSRPGKASLPLTCPFNRLSWASRKALPPIVLFVPELEQVTFRWKPKNEEKRWGESILHLTFPSGQTHLCFLHFHAVAKTAPGREGLPGQISLVVSATWRQDLGCTFRSCRLSSRALKCTLRPADRVQCLAGLENHFSSPSARETPFRRGSVPRRPGASVVSFGPAELPRPPQCSP